MLIELAVRDLGVVEDLSIVLGAGMTSISGETGAGKTLVVGAIELLTGGRADPSLVRAGADEAVVEGRFEIDGDEIIARRIVPRTGRSRAYLGGRLCSAAELASWATEVVDLHGQHDHQSLLGSAVQRAALDAFAGSDVDALAAARAQVRSLAAALEELGGDERSRQRTIDLLRFQIDEIEAAAISGPDEGDELDLLEDELADAAAHREAATSAHGALADDGGASDEVGRALDLVRDRAPFSDLAQRLASLQAEIAEVAGALRSTGEAIDEDPVRLTEVRERRQLLRDLQRKHGATLEEVLAARDTARAELAELEGHAQRVAALEGEQRSAAAALEEVEARIGEQRRVAAPLLAKAVTERLGSLAMPGAHLEVGVGDGAGDEVTFLLAANSGQPAGPLARAASGGELARAMLALRLVLTAGPPLLVFDEVDAGVGGQAAQAVGEALAEVAAAHQVLVVTHLPQVAAAASAQILVEKHDDGRTTRTTARPLAEDERVLEVSRMLAGRPDSDAAQDHARELLAARRGAAGRRS